MKKQHSDGNNTAKKTPAAKRVSVKSVVGKAVDLLKKPFAKGGEQKPPARGKKPFGGKCGRKKKPTAADIRRAEAEKRIAEIEKESENAYSEQNSSSGISSVFGSFFYTDDKFINEFEDAEILEYIRSGHSEYDPKAGDELKLKKAIIGLLDDSPFMTGLLARYNMTIFEFFKFLYRMEPSVFRGAFIPKL